MEPFGGNQAPKAACPAVGAISVSLVDYRAHLQQKRAAKHAEKCQQQKQVLEQMAQFHQAQQSWMGKVKDCPTYYPTVDEFADPVAYIRKIQPVAARFGMCKVVPPVQAAIPPGLVLNSIAQDKKTFTFNVRVQQMRPTTWTSWSSGDFSIKSKRYNLADYQHHATAYASKKYGTAAHMPPQHVEAEYWRQRSADLPQPSSTRPHNDADHSLVEYANDVDGTAFAPRETGDPLACTAWNTNSLPSLEGTLMPFIPYPIPGVTQPMLYIGMLHATFAWHIEDHCLYSLNYHHMGAPKTWYTVPGPSADAFESLVLEQVYAPVMEAERQAGLPAATVRDNGLAALLNKTTMVSPELLMERGVEVYRAVQQPGEYIITFPRAYHAGFSHGFNCGEAVNFAMAEWLPYGAAADARLCRLRRRIIIPYDQVLCQAAMVALEHLTPSVACQEGSSGRGAAAGSGLQRRAQRQAGTVLGSTSGGSGGVAPVQAQATPGGDAPTRASHPGLLDAAAGSHARGVCSGEALPAAGSLPAQAAAAAGGSAEAAAAVDGGGTAQRIKAHKAGRCGGQDGSAAQDAGGSGLRLGIGMLQAHERDLAPLSRALASFLTQVKAGQPPPPDLTTLLCFWRRMRVQYVQHHALMAAGAQQQQMLPSGCSSVCPRCEASCFLAYVAHPAYNDQHDVPGASVQHRCVPCAAAALLGRGGGRLLLAGVSSAAMGASVYANPDLDAMMDWAQLLDPILAMYEGPVTSLDPQGTGLREEALYGDVSGLPAEAYGWGAPYTWEDRPLQLRLPWPPPPAPPPGAPNGANGPSPGALGQGAGCREAESAALGRAPRRRGRPTVREASDAADSRCPSYGDNGRDEDDDEETDTDSEPIGVKASRRSGAMPAPTRPRLSRAQQATMARAAATAAAAAARQHAAVRAPAAAAAVCAPVVMVGQRPPVADTVAHQHWQAAPLVAVAPRWPPLASVPKACAWQSDGLARAGTGAWACNPSRTSQAGDGARVVSIERPASDAVPVSPAARAAPGPADEHPPAAAPAVEAPHSGGAAGVRSPFAAYAGGAAGACRLTDGQTRGSVPMQLMPGASLEQSADIRSGVSGGVGTGRSSGALQGAGSMQGHMQPELTVSAASPDMQDVEEEEDTPLSALARQPAAGAAQRPAAAAAAVVEAQAPEAAQQVSAGHTSGSTGTTPPPAGVLTTGDPSNPRPSHLPPQTGSTGLKRRRPCDADGAALPPAPEQPSATPDPTSAAPPSMAAHRAPMRTLIRSPLFADDASMAGRPPKLRRVLDVIAGLPTIPSYHARLKPTAAKVKAAATAARSSQAALLAAANRQRSMDPPPHPLTLLPGGHIAPGAGKGPAAAPTAQQRPQVNGAQRLPPKHHIVVIPGPGNCPPRPVSSSVSGNDGGPRALPAPSGEARLSGPSQAQQQHPQLSAGAAQELLALEVQRVVWVSIDSASGSDSPTIGRQRMACHVLCTARAAQQEGAGDCFLRADELGALLGLGAVSGCAPPGGVHAGLLRSLLQEVGLLPPAPGQSALLLAATFHRRSSGGGSGSCGNAAAAEAEGSGAALAWPADVLSTRSLAEVRAALQAVPEQAPLAAAIDRLSQRLGLARAPQQPPPLQHCSDEEAPGANVATACMEVDLADERPQAMPPAQDPQPPPLPVRPSGDPHMNIVAELDDPLLMPEVAVAGLRQAEARLLQQWQQNGNPQQQQQANSAACGVSAGAGPPEPPELLHSQEPADPLSQLDMGDAGLGQSLYLWADPSNDLLASGPSCMGMGIGSSNLASEGMHGAASASAPGTSGMQDFMDSGSGGGSSFPAPEGMMVPQHAHGGDEELLRLAGLGGESADGRRVSASGHGGGTAGAAGLLQHVRSALNIGENAHKHQDGNLGSVPPGWVTVGPQQTPGSSGGGQQQQQHAAVPQPPQHRSGPTRPVLSEFVRETQRSDSLLQLQLIQQLQQQLMQQQQQQQLAQQRQDAGYGCVELGDVSDATIEAQLRRREKQLAAGPKAPQLVPYERPQGALAQQQQPTAQLVPYERPHERLMAQYEAAPSLQQARSDNCMGNASSAWAQAADERHLDPHLDLHPQHQAAAHVRRGHTPTVSGGRDTGSRGMPPLAPSGSRRVPVEVHAEYQARSQQPLQVTGGYSADGAPTLVLSTTPLQGRAGHWSPGQVLVAGANRSRLGSDSGAHAARTLGQSLDLGDEDAARAAHHAAVPRGPPGWQQQQQLQELQQHLQQQRSLQQRPQLVSSGTTLHDSAQLPRWAQVLLRSRLLDDPTGAQPDDGTWAHPSQAVTGPDADRPQALTRHPSLARAASGVSDVPVGSVLPSALAVAANLLQQKQQHGRAAAQEEAWGLANSVQQFMHGGSGGGLAIGGSRGSGPLAPERCQELPVQQQQQAGACTLPVRPAHEPWANHGVRLTARSVSHSVGTSINPHSNLLVQHALGISRTGSGPPDRPQDAPGAAAAAAVACSNASGPRQHPDMFAQGSGAGQPPFTGW